MDFEAIHTAEEYLAFERESGRRNEFVNRRIYPIAGESLAHNSIVGNIRGELRARLRGTECRSYHEGIRLKVSETGVYTYPDVMALCGESVVDDAHGDTLLNPAVVIEVLSPATELTDRSEKFAHYIRLPTLREYLLVAQEQVRIERYVRQGEQWVYSTITDPAASLIVESLGCDISMGEIYRGVEFPPDPANRWPKLG